MSRPRTPVPVARGFATWGTDSGHDNKKLTEPRAFALNDEALINMAYASYKKTHDVGVRLTRALGLARHQFPPLRRRST